MKRKAWRVVQGVAGRTSWRAGQKEGRLASASANQGRGREGPLELLLKAEQLSTPDLTRTQRVLLLVESWPWPRIAAAVCMLVAVGLVGLGMWWWPMVQDRVAQAVAHATGATVQSIPVTGAGLTEESELLAALGLKKGDSLVGFDTRAARARLEALPWVRLASVERQLPATVRVTLYEHVPLARVVAEGQVWVVNQAGQRLVNDADNRFASLPLVRGEGAEKAVPELFAALSVWPALNAQVREATWMGGRRWNVRFASGLTVLLPETGAAGLAKPLATLAQLEDARHVLSLPDGSVDLRLSDRIVLRLPETVGATPVTNREGHGQDEAGESQDQEPGASAPDVRQG